MARGPRPTPADSWHPTGSSGATTKEIGRISTEQANALLGGNGHVLDADGSKIGKAGQVYLDDRSGEPAWVTVRTGLFGGAESFVPLAQATSEGDDLRVPYGKDQVKDAPRIGDADQHLSREEEAELYRYYGLVDPEPDLGDRQQGAADTRGDVTGGRGQDAGPEESGRDQRTDSDAQAARAAGTGAGAGGDLPAAGRGAAGHDTSGPDTDDAMTRSEEQVRVGTETETVGRARLRKYVVTENVTTTVPVSHEEVRVEREPITDANVGDATSGGDITEEEHEVELKGERVTVEKETVPVERVRLGTETVTEEQQVSEEVRKEQIDADTDGADRGRGR